jgi:hypothetical protein
MRISEFDNGHCLLFYSKGWNAAASTLRLRGLGPQFGREVGSRIEDLVNVQHPAFWQGAALRPLQRLLL